MFFFKEIFSCNRCMWADDKQTDRPNVSVQLWKAAGLMTHSTGRQTLLCDLGDIEKEVHFFPFIPLSLTTGREVLFAKMSSIYASFFWLDEQEKLKLCFRKGTLFYFPR